MKKIIFFILALIFGTGNLLNAQLHTSVKPSAFMIDEEITITFNVCATDLKDNTGPVILWTAANDGVLENKGECTAVDDNKWSFTMTPTSFFGNSPDSIRLMLKDEAGTVETPVSTIAPYDFSQATTMLTIYPTPSAYSESVSLIFNAAMSTPGTLTGVSPIYAWCWIPGGADAPDQGTWGSYTPKALCTQIDGDIWRKEFIPQEYWQSSAPMTEFGILFVNANGTQQTVDNVIPLVQPFTCAEPSISFPRKFTQSDVVTIICDTKKTEYEMLNNVGDVYIYTYTNAGDSTDYNPMPAHNWIIYPPAMVDRAKMTDVGDGVYEITIIPYQYFEIDDPNYVITDLTFVFRNRLGNVEALETKISVLPADN